MTLAIVYSRASAGIKAPLVTVEAHISPGFPGLHMVGLPETAVKESKDRVRSAIINSQFDFPARRITINLAPADLPKEGGRFDLPIALGILAASQQIPTEKLATHEFTGELALTGELRRVRGVLPVVLGARQISRSLIVPEENAIEASVVQGAEVFSAKNLLEVCAYLQGKQLLPNCFSPVESCEEIHALDLSDVRGQLHAKRALEVAAAGKHSLLFVGPPGTGKTMLASRLPSILPPLTEEEALEVAAIASISHQGFEHHTWRKLPFRSPHHSSSGPALVGGGRPPKPGEISLAHHGVLFLDELPEFNRQVLECLREPFESGHITISRASFQSIFPARFQWVAAMNPCPCGYIGSATRACQCTREQVQRYLTKLSGPLLDRIDMQIEVPTLASELLSVNAEYQSEKSKIVKARVLIARQKQFARQNKLNSDMTTPDIQQFCQLDTESQKLLNQVMNKFNFSARIYHRILKVARTIADLQQSDTIGGDHLSEAFSFRYLDRRVSPISVS